MVKQVTTSITNMDESLNLKFTVIWVDESVKAMDQGVIDWSVLEEMENQTIFEVEPGETKDFSDYEPKNGIWLSYTMKPKIWTTLLK